MKRNFKVKGQFRIKPCDHGQARFVVDGTINGKRIREYFRTSQEAKAHCQRRNIELGNFGTELFNISTALRSEAIQCQERLDPLGVSLTAAVDFYLATHDLRKKSIKFAELWRLAKAELERQVIAIECSAALLAKIAYAANRAMPDFGDKQLVDLTPQVLWQWLINVCGEDGKSLATQSRNNLRLSLSWLFSFAKRSGYINEHPIKDRVDKFKVAPKDVTILTPEQAEALLLGAPIEILPYFAIALFAGIRRAEICRLTWENINWDEGIIELRGRSTKTGDTRFPAICEALLAFLAPYKGSTGWIVPRNRVRELMEETRAAAGITEWPANALRHSFCSYYVALNGSAATAFAAGHRNEQTTYSHYLYAVKEDAAKKYFAIRPAAPTNVIAMGSAAA